MQDVKITIKKDDVFEEVEKTSAYVGSKNIDSNGRSLYDSVFVTDTDRQMLERFWQDAQNSVSSALSRVIGHTDVDSNGNYTICLAMPDNFQIEQLPNLQSTAMNYVVNVIVAEWCNVSAKGEMENYTKQAETLLLQMKRIIYSRCRPIRTF